MSKFGRYVFPPLIASLGKANTKEANSKRQPTPRIPAQVYHIPRHLQVILNAHVEIGGIFK